MITRRPLAALRVATLLFVVFSAMPAYSGGVEVLPVDRDTRLDASPMGLAGMKKAVPAEGRVNIRRDETSAGITSKKEPLVRLVSPAPGNVAGSYQRLTGRVGGSIAKILLRVNDDVEIVSASDGTFETSVSLEPGRNRITALAWDLEGNLGKDSMTLDFSQLPDAPKVDVTSPPDGSSINITENSVIKVRAVTDDLTAKDGWLVVNGIPRRVTFNKGRMDQEVALFPGTNRVFVEVIGREGRSGVSRAVVYPAFDARPKDLAAVLTWDSAVADFDLHVWDSFGHHTFNEAPDWRCSDASIPGGRLDMDRKGGYGPEVFSLDMSSQEVYTFYVKYSPGVREKAGGRAGLRIILNGSDPSRKIVRSFGPAALDTKRPIWEAAHVKMPEGVFFQDKDSDLVKTLIMDSKAVRRLGLMLDDESEPFQLLAISAMGLIKSEEAIGPLLSELSGGTPPVRRASAAALWSIKSVRSAAGLAAGLKDPDPEVRRLSAGALGNLGSRDYTPALTGLLAEEAWPSVRVEALRALGRTADPAAVESVLSLARDADPSVRAEALRTLGFMADPKLEDVIKDGLSDAEQGVREVAAWALGRTARRETLRTLSDLLRFDENEGVRIQAASAIGGVKDESAVEELKRAVEKDASEKVRFCATKALGRVKPQPVPSSWKPGPAAPEKKDDDLIEN